MIRFIPLFLCFLVIVSNIYIYSLTEKKIEIYKDFPPFPVLDFTKSNRIDTASQVGNLLDGNPETYWKKKRDANGWDIDLELKLTHILQNGKFIPRKFTTIELLSCNDSIMKGNILSEFVFRESINVDKVLRLPNETKLFSKELVVSSNRINISLEEFPELKESIKYPEGISIFAIKLKFTDFKEEVCISELILK